MTGLGHLLSPKLGQFRNMSRSDERAHVGALFLFVGLGVAFWIGLFFGAHWFFARCYEVELVGQILVRKVLDMVFLTFLSVLLFSNIITSFTTFLLAEDLPLLVAAPIPSDRLYHGRLLETTVHSSWMVLIFGLPILAAAGVVFNAGADYYLYAAATLPPFLVIPAVMGSALTLILATTFPARRSRDLLVLLAVMLFAVLYLLFRLLEPERLLDPDGFRDMVHFLQTFQAPASVWIPSYWATEAIFPALRGNTEQSSLYVGLLYSSAGAAVVLGTWISRSLLLAAFSRAMEGRAGEGVASRVGRWLTGPLRRVFGDRPDAIPSPAKALVLKDSRLFFRDTAQWSQLLLLAALVVVYLFNFKNFRVLDESGLISPLGLYFLNLGLAGFVVAALAVRFVFPAVSLEGRAFWILRTAPISMSYFLRAKLVGVVLPLVVFSSLLAVLTNWVIGSAWSLALISTVTVSFVACGVCGLGMGLGAAYPRFRVENPAKIASGFGGVVYMILAMVLVFAVLCLEFYPMYLFYHGVVSGQMQVTARQLLIGGSLGLSSILLCLVATLWPIRLGARRLRDWGA